MMKHFFKPLLSVIITAALLCSCAFNADTMKENSSEQSMPENSSMESKMEASEPDNAFTKYPVDTSYGEPIIDTEITKKTEAENAVGVRYLEDNILYVLTINPSDDVQADGGMLMKLGEYACSDGTVAILGTTRGYFDHANPFAVNMNKDGSVSVLLRNRLLGVKDGSVFQEASYDNEMYSNRAYSFGSGKLVCYDGEGDIILVNPLEPKSKPTLVYSKTESFSFLAISPNGEKIAFFNQGRVECYSAKGEKLFETAEIDLQSRDYVIKWLSDDMLLFMQSIEEKAITEGFIFDSEGKTKKSLMLNYYFYGTQENAEHSYPNMLAACLLPIGEYGDGKGDNYGLALINLEDGTAKLLRNTEHQILSYDISDDGKKIFWLENDNLFMVEKKG